MGSLLDLSRPDAVLPRPADPRHAPGTRAAYDFVRRHVGFMETDRRLDRELTSLATALREEALPWDTGLHPARRAAELTAGDAEEAGRA